MSQDPQIFDIDPEGAPRMTAIILLACGVLGVCFLLVNVVFTGQDQYYVEEEWQEGNEPVNQRYDIMPNLVRGRHVDADSEEDEEAQDVPVKKPAAKKKASTTGPVYPFQVKPAGPTTMGSGGR
jgi:hypothetical protein